MHSSPPDRQRRTNLSPAALLVAALALLNLACAAVRRPAADITYTTTPAAVRAAIDSLEQDPFATTLDRALGAYDRGLGAIDQEAWDQAYAELGRARQEISKLAAPRPGEDPLLIAAADLLREEVELLLEETELHTSVEPLGPGLAVGADSLLSPAAAAGYLQLERNAKVEHYIQLFTGSRRRSFEATLRRSGRYLPMIRQTLAEEGIAPELAWLPVIESGMRTTAVSRAQAVGLWQFIRSTGRLYHLRIDEFVDERRDPIAATRAAARHLHDLYDHFHDWPLALAAYNCGQRRVERAIVKAGTRDYWQLALPRETREYVPQFFAAALLAADPAAAGLSSATDPPLRYDQVEVPELVSLQTVAECTGSREKEIRDLNPHLWRTLTPPGATTQVRVPAGRGERFAAAFARLPRTRLSSTVSHRVRRGETLSGIANRYGSSVRLIAATNHLRNSHRIRAGQKLLIPVRATEVASSKRRGAGHSSRAGSRRTSYTVRSGDSLWSIARRHGVSVERLTRANGLHRNSLLHPGQHLRIPWQDGSSTYVVARGDNLSSIAKQVRVRVADLARWNGLDPGQPIHPGQRLRIAAAGSGSAQAARTRVKTHKVAPGESVYTIAKRYGVRTSDVLRWNQLDSRALIHPGDRLEIRSLN